MKTAVTHVQEKLEALGIYTSTMRQIIEYAKEEEKAQIIQAHNNGTDWGSLNPEAEEYNGKNYFEQHFNLK